MTGEARRKEIRGIHRKHKFFYEMLGGGIVLVVSILIGATQFGGENQDYPMNLFTEGMGIVATVFIINRWYAKRELESLKQRLIREAGSRSHDIAISAVEWLDREGWLRGEDGLLKGADLREARLQGVRMEGANLEGVNLDAADLRGANLRGAILHNANLFRADLRCWTKLREADLSGAKLSLANLERADLQKANLNRANLSRANLRGADLVNATLKDAMMLETNLETSNLYEADLEGANLMHANLKTPSSLKNATLKGANLSFVDLEGADLCEMDLSGATLQCVDLRNAKLFDTNLQSADLRGAYLEGASLLLEERRYECYTKRSTDCDWTREEIVWTGTILTGATLPDGKAFTEYMGNEDIAPYIDSNHEEFGATLKKIDEHPARKRSRN
ncbi:MAG: pentapeptide repeat-containing protein [Chloroflexi bacterium]|nr:pentapeptide repeat-containing protein [Chloroflexota bacterium]